MQIHLHHKWLGIPYVGQNWELQVLSPSVPTRVLLHICSINEIQQGASAESIIRPTIQKMIYQFPDMLSVPASLPLSCAFRSSFVYPRVNTSVRSWNSNIVAKSLCNAYNIIHSIASASLSPIVLSPLIRPLLSIASQKVGWIIPKTVLRSLKEVVLATFSEEP